MRRTRPPIRPAPRLKLWIVFGGRTKVGDGRVRLFELIDELGSIKKAVERMGMSYRAAWGYIQELEADAGFPFLRRKPGGGSAGGARLTREGRAFLARYRRLQGALDLVVTRRFGAVFGATRRRLPRA